MASYPIRPQPQYWVNKLFVEQILALSPVELAPCSNGRGLFRIRRLAVDTKQLEGSRQVRGTHAMLHVTGRWNPLAGGVL